MIKGRKIKDKRKLINRQTSRPIIRSISGRVHFHQIYPIVRCFWDRPSPANKLGKGGGRKTMFLFLQKNEDAVVSKLSVLCARIPVQLNCYSQFVNEMYIKPEACSAERTLANILNIINWCCRRALVCPHCWTPRPLNYAIYTWPFATIISILTWNGHFLAFFSRKHLTQAWTNLIFAIDSSFLCIYERNFFVQKSAY